MFNKARAALAASAAALLNSSFAAMPHHMGRTRYIGGYKPPRSKYRPHQGKAEIARRLRQAERDRVNQIARGKSREVLTSRRGYYICEA